MICKCGKQALRGKTFCLSCFFKQTQTTKKPRRNSHKEDDTQKEFFKSVRLLFPKLGKLIFHVPNGGNRNIKEAMRLKDQGVISGVSDIICLVPNGIYSFLCLELKIDKNDQSDEQKQFQKEVEQSGGLYLVFRSVNEGIELLKEYLQGTNYM